MNEDPRWCNAATWSSHHHWSQCCSLNYFQCCFFHGQESFGFSFGFTVDSQMMFCCSLVPLSICLFVDLFVRWFVYLFVCLSICLLVCLFVCWFVYLFACWSICSFVCCSICSKVCWSICLFACLLHLNLWDAEKCCRSKIDSFGSETRRSIHYRF